MPELPARAAKLFFVTLARLARGGAAQGRGVVKQRCGDGKNALGPNAAFAGFEPYDAWAEMSEGCRGEQLFQKLVDAFLERAIFGSESIGSDSIFERGNSDEERVSLHPPGKPGFQLRLAAEFVDEVAVVVQHGAVADDIGSAARGVELRSDLRVENPELAFECRGRIYGKRRLAGDFGDQVDIVVGLFQQRADFIGKSCLANAMRSDKRELQIVRRFLRPNPF